MGEQLVVLEDVEKTYRVGEVSVHALRNVDLVVEAGEFVVVLGPSGSGKTTLLNLIGGIDRTSSGRVTVAGRDLAGLSERELTNFRKRQIGFIFQFFNLIPTLTATENVALASELVSSDSSAVGPVLEAVGLAGRESHFPNQLSGGEQQRVAVARALAKNSPLMLCDEPTGELDFETGRTILGLLRRLNRERKQTFILVTHNAVVGQIGDRVVRLRSGEIAEDRRNQKPLDPMELEW